MNLVKTEEQLQQEMQAAQQQQQQQALLDQAGQLASSPMLDPSKNPNLNGEQTDTPEEGTPTEDQITGG